VKCDIYTVKYDKILSIIFYSFVRYLFASKASKSYYGSSIIAISAFYSGSPRFVLDCVQQNNFFKIDVSNPDTWMMMFYGCETAMFCYCETTMFCYCETGMFCYCWFQFSSCQSPCCNGNIVINSKINWFWLQANVYSYLRNEFQSWLGRVFASM
jgi:hypothetical protein